MINLITNLATGRDSLRHRVSCVAHSCRWLLSYRASPALPSLKVNYIQNVCFFLYVLAIFVAHFLPRFLDEHLLEANDLPLLGVSVERQVRVLDLAATDGTRLDLAAGNGACQVVRPGLDGEVGQRQVPRVARRDRRGACG